MTTPSPHPVTQGRIARLWAPLAASWLLMGLELPLVTAAVARLPDEAVNLAAYGGVVMPLSLVIEAPIMMLLAASTALCRDRVSFALVRRFMMLSGAGLTALHALIAFTPLFDVFVLDVIGAPPAILEPARLGLRLMLPWTWAIAWRRFNQGLLIRAGRSRPVAIGTAIRLVANGSVLAGGVLHGELPGLAIGAVGISTGVVTEAVFISVCARDSARRLRATEPPPAPLRWHPFLAFYVPLALTQVLSLTLPPLGAAALSRMPHAFTSLAAWPAAFGAVFVFRSVSYALNEVTVSLLEQPGAAAGLRRFARRLGVTTSGVLLLVVASPLADLWFGSACGLPPELARISRIALALAALQPVLAAAEMWLQGRLVHARRTRSITVGMLLHLGAAAAGYGLGIAWAPLPGIFFAMLVLTSAAIVKTTFLAFRARAVAPDPS